MANKNQHFGELEYCFGQYFSRYCAPVITKDYNYYQRKQQEEFNKAYSENVVTGKLKTSELRVKLNLTNSTYYKYVREYRKNIRLEKDGIYV